MPLTTTRLVLIASLLLMLLTGSAWTLIRPACVVPARRLVDILPPDLDKLQSKNLMGALGIQLLAYGGWSSEAKGGGGWSKEPGCFLRRRRGPLTLKDRLAFITPTWKEVGSLDYNRIFADGGAFLDAHGRADIETVAQLADLLEHKVGLGVADFDDVSISALKAMLSWQIKGKNSTSLNDKGILLFVLSFGNEESCRDTSDCPLGPGATNELLAATAAQFVQQHEQEVKILAQWEVATALWQQHNDTLQDTIVKSIGNPGTYATTADVLKDMLFHAWLNDSPVAETIILLAHPDHLRRVLWTAESILKRRCPYFLRSSDCSVRLLTAMQPYSLDWPDRRSSASKLNLYDSLEPTEVRIGRKTIATDWYETSHLGYFSDDSDQEWTQDREKWILYDHWAVLKGIVTGTIDHCTRT